MRSSGLLALVLAVAPFGCGDDIKFPDQTVLPDPALNGVFPASGFTDRTIRVEISGDGTEFTSGATVTFSGTGVTVSNTGLASPSDLFIDVTIAGDAPLGKRDVTVTDGAKTVDLKQAFEIKNPLEVIVTGGEVEQAGIADLVIINHDPENQFIGPVTITNGAGALIFRISNTENLIRAQGRFDADATSVPLSVSFSVGSANVISHASALAVAARAPTALTPNEGGTTSFNSGAVTMTHRTAFFSFPATSAIWRGTPVPDEKSNPNFEEPVVVWLKGGKWADARGFADDDLVPMTEGENGLVVVVESFFDTDFLFDLNVNNFTPLPAVQAIAEVEPNDPFDGGTGVAQTITVGTTPDHRLFTGVLAFDPNTLDDFDVFEVQIADRQSIRVTTTMGTGGTADTEVLIDDVDFEFFSDSNDDISVGTFLFASDLTTPPLNVGTYLIRIHASPSSFGAFDDPYEAGIVIQDNPNNTFAPPQLLETPTLFKHRGAPAANQIKKVAPTPAIRWRGIQRTITKNSP